MCIDPVGLEELPREDSGKKTTGENKTQINEKQQQINKRNEVKQKHNQQRNFKL